MRDITKVLVIGLGAIGSIYAAKLKDYDPGCVRVLVDKDRLERYKTHGIVLNGVRPDFNYVLPGPKEDKADLILIATEADGLQEAISALENFSPDRTNFPDFLNR